VAEKPGTLADGGEVLTGDPPPAGDWPDDWRDKLAGGDKETQALLKRFGSPAAVARALKDTRAQVSKGAVAALPEDATEEDKAAWRKARGVPDKPEAYDLATPPKGMEWSDDSAARCQSQSRCRRTIPAEAVLAPQMHRRPARRLIRSDDQPPRACGLRPPRGQRHPRLRQRHG
jgi:hypothetical protein